MVIQDNTVLESKPLHFGEQTAPHNSYLCSSTNAQTTRAKRPSPRFDHGFDIRVLRVLDTLTLTREFKL